MRYIFIIYNLFGEWRMENGEMNVYGLYVCVFRSEVEEGRCQYGDWHVICYAINIIEYDRRTPELAV